MSRNDHQRKILSLSARQLSHLLRTSQITAVEVMTITLDRIATLNPIYNAIVSLRDTRDLLSEAQALDDSSIPISERGPLHGIPLAIKDALDVKGLPITKGSSLFAEHVASMDDPIVSRIKTAGAIVIGKTNLPEFGLGSHTFNDVFGTTLNSYNISKSAGGSSGGAAVALATRMVWLSDGSDMMGSLRNPAGWNNLYSLRPTVGLLPPNDDEEEEEEENPFPLSTVGPMARNPLDVHFFLEVLSDRNVTVSEHPNLQTIKIGWLGDWGGAYPMQEGVLQICRSALTMMEDECGCHVHNLPPPFDSTQLWSSWTTLRSKYISENLPVHEIDKLKPEAIWEIQRGQNLSQDEIDHATSIAAEWSECAQTLLETYDILALPSSQVFAFDAHLRYPETISDRTMDTYHRWMEVMIPVSLIGVPCVTIPVGFKDGLSSSMGMQLFGWKGEDRKVLEVAQGYHLMKDWVEEHPPDCVCGKDRKEANNV